MTLAEIEKELDEATEAMAREDARYRAASCDHTAAMNRLNAAQLAFDVAVKEKRKAAPRCSDWHSQKQVVAS